MLKTLAEKLVYLSKDLDGAFHGKVRDRIGKKATHLFERRLKNLICLMPRLVYRGLEYCRRKEIPAEVKKSIGFTLTYLYHPKDFLPEDHEDLFGYLDDAYCVGLVHERILKALQKARVKLSAADEDFLQQFVLMKRSVKAVIPDEAKAVSEMVAGMLKGHYEPFRTLFN